MKIDAMMFSATVTVGEGAPILALRDEREMNI
jgi:hypothetical protein